MFPGRSIIFFGTMGDEKQTFCSWNTCSDSGGAPPIALPWLSDPGSLTMGGCHHTWRDVVHTEHSGDIIVPRPWKLLPFSWHHNWVPLRPINHSISCSIRQIMVRIINSMRMDPVPHFICCEINPLVSNGALGKSRMMDKAFCNT